MLNDKSLGRNDPCPCGSQKKYKKCHGAPVQDYTQPVAEAKIISRDLAYKGDIGRTREEFSAKFVENKQAIYASIVQAQLEAAKNKGETITCGKGCGYCCTQYVDASIQEGEAIVYYLYNNEKILENFLQAYPVWREKVRAAGDSFEKITHHWEKTGDGKWRDRKTVEGGLAEFYAFTIADVACPFLVDSSCSIYPVRPYVCAGAYATTPAELCRPLTRSRAKIYTSLSSDIVNDTSLYSKSLRQPVQSIMPVMVYEILTRGLAAIREFTGLTELR